MALAYGICVGPSDKYERIMKPTLNVLAPEAPVYERRDQLSIFEAYNSIIEEHLASAAADMPLVLIHEDVELRVSLDERITELLSDPDVAIIGAIGGKGVQSVRWSRSKEKFGRAPDLVNGENKHSEGTHEVDIVDGLILVLSPWAVRHLRFDTETYSGFHAYDADISMQARALGMKVLVTDLDLIHHSKGGYGDVRRHRLGDDAFRRKWGIPLDPMLRRLKRRIRNLEY